MHQRHVLVTGGGGGLGRSVCERFLSHGAHVHACDLDAQALQALVEWAKTAGAAARLQTTVADVSKDRDVEVLFKDALEWLHSIDALVNSVGISGPRSPMETIPLEQWESVLAANLLGAIRCTRAVLPSMKTRRRGVIVYVSSSSVFTNPSQRSPYIVSKASLEGLTSALAREVGHFGIRCNAVRPGLMNNERGRGVIERVAAQSGRTYDDVLKSELDYFAMKSMVEMDEVAAAIEFLCSDDARHITGQIIAVDAGHIYES